MGRHHGLHPVLRSKNSSMFMHTYDIHRTNILSRLVIKHTLHGQKSEPSSEDEQMIDNKRAHLERLINVFEHQADTFLHDQSSVEDYPISLLGDYGGFDISDVAPDAIEDNEDARHFQSLPFRASNGLGMEGLNPEDCLILLPSSLGWEWCNTHGAKSLAEKEVQLCYARANDSIHQICLALGFKSAIFHTQV